MSKRINSKSLRKSRDGADGAGRAQRNGPLASRERRIAELELQFTQMQMREQELDNAQKEVRKESQYFSELFNSAPIGYMVLNKDGQIVEINEAGAILLLTRRDRLIGQPFARFLDEETLQAYLEYLHKCRTGQKTRVEVVLRRGANWAVPVELTTVCQPDGSRGMLYRVAIVDISDRRKAERALEESREKYRDLVNAVLGIVWEGNGTTRAFTFVSDQAARITGYPPAVWTKDLDFLANHLHPEDRDRTLRERRREIDKGKNFVQEFRMITAERQTIWLRDSVTITPAAQGRIKLRGVMVNITELKEVEQALREESHALEILNRVGTSLAAELDLKKLAQAVTEAGKEVTGAQVGVFSFSHASHGADGEAVSPHTSGGPQELFEDLPRPRHNPATRGVETEHEIIRIDDVAGDRRLARGRSTLRSYLAAPVVSRTGEELGGLYFGHRSPGVFTERSEHLLAGIAAEAAIALDNARLYDAVRKSEAHFRELAEAMPQIVWTAQADGSFDYFNRQWYDYIGQPEGKVTQDWSPLLHPEDRANCVAKWQESVAEGCAFQSECRLRDKGGRYRWHLVRAVPIRDANGRVSRWFGTCTDINDSKRAEEEVRELNAVLERRVQERTAQLQASNRELEAFSYSVSHDLRAPLRSIDAFSQLLEEDYADKLDDQGRQYLNVVSESSRAMSRLIDDLLHLSRVTRAELRRQEVSISELAGQIAANLRQREPQRDVDVVIAPELKASADERLLRIALENLLGNAWKFTAKQPKGRVEIGRDGQDNQAFFVRDNGAGFDMEYSDKLFTAFQRLHSTREFPGHGIGLATVQRIISRHGGRVWATGQLGAGATFYFTLPAEENGATVGKHPAVPEAARKV